MKKKEYSLELVLTVYSGKAVRSGFRFSDLHNLLQFVTKTGFSMDWMARAADETKTHVFRQHEWLESACAKIKQADDFDDPEFVTWLESLKEKYGEMISLCPDFGYAPPTALKKSVHIAEYSKTMNIIEIDID